MILHDRKLILNNGKSCYMRSGEAEDSRKLALYFRQAVQEDEPQELLVGEVPDVYQTRRILQQFAEEERRILLLAWMHRQIGRFRRAVPGFPLCAQTAPRASRCERPCPGTGGSVSGRCSCSSSCTVRRNGSMSRSSWNCGGTMRLRRRYTGSVAFSTRLVREQGYKLPQGYTDALVMERRLDYIR